MCGLRYMGRSLLLQGTLPCNLLNKQETRSKSPCSNEVTFIFQGPSEKKNKQKPKNENPQQTKPKTTVENMAGTRVPGNGSLGFLPTCCLEERTRPTRPHQQVRSLSPPITAISGLNNEVPEAPLAPIRFAEGQFLRQKWESKGKENEKAGLVLPVSRPCGHD